MDMNIAVPAAVGQVPVTTRPLAITLVCFTAGKARRYTQLQYRDIFAACAPAGDVQLSCITLDAGADGVALMDAARPDGIIIAGMQPGAGPLSAEPMWPTLAGLVDYAADTAMPAVWSCLAAHAAVLHLDGIERRKLPRKLSGLVTCKLEDAADKFAAGLPARWQIPHSRYYEVPRQSLQARGYRMLSTICEGDGDDGGADIFTRPSHPRFLFCQGHPEYDAQALLREYRRDIRLFLGGERNEYPAMPDHCFGLVTASKLAIFQDRASRERNISLLADFPSDACAGDLHHSWRGPALTLFANWLSQIGAGPAIQPANFFVDDEAGG